MTGSSDKLGACLCGAVRWRYRGAFDAATHCHCSMCRKSHGTAFATYVMGARSGFEWLAGEALLVRRESSPGFIRSFCGQCGSVAPNVFLGDRIAAPAAGFADEGPGIKPEAHIYVKDKAPWEILADHLPRHDWYPGESGPAVSRASSAPSTDGLLRGSCLCGAVAFELREAFQRIQNCHCSRCRRGRAAAHSVNGLSGPDSLGFIKGEDAVRQYRPAGARYFAQAFCQHCGGKLPRYCPDRRITITPLGALDDDPGRGPERHIFVGSRAPWFDIADLLPQCLEAPP